MISEVIVNHTERNYFNDYSETRSDMMCGVDTEKVCKAIDKLCRRFKAHGECDVLFAYYEDGTGFRLMYDYDRELAKGGTYEKALTIRHLTANGGWDFECTTTAAAAKRLVKVEERAMLNWKGEGWYRIGWSDGGEDFTNDGPLWLEDALALGAEVVAAEGLQTETHLPFVEYMGDGDEPEEQE